MQRITITMDRVFDVTTGQSRYREACTFFSFQSAQASQFGIAAPGSPNLRNGMTVSALLERCDDWQTLLGWVNHDNGEIVCRSRGYQAFFVLWSIPVGIILLVFCKESPKIGTACLFALAFYIYLNAKEYASLTKARRTLKEIRDVELHRV